MDGTQIQFRMTIEEHDFNNAINNAKEKNNITFVYIGNASIAHDYNSLVEFFDNNYELPNLKINIFSKLKILNTITNQSIEQKPLASACGDPVFGSTSTLSR